MPSFLIVLLCFVPTTILGLGTEQSVAVEGKFLCNGKPYENAKVKLYDEDVGLDDLMAEGVSKADGTFQLHGTETEITRIDPKLNIYSNCNDEDVECWRKVSIRIPDDFVFDGKVAKKTFNIGILNLSGKLPGETRDCLN